MHLGTNILVNDFIKILFLCGFGFGCCAFLLGDRNMHTSQFVLFQLLMLERTHHGRSEMVTVY